MDYKGNKEAHYLVFVKRSVVEIVSQVEKRPNHNSLDLLLFLRGLKKVVKVVLACHDREYPLKIK